MDKILIVITGIGNPHYNEKFKILNNNLKLIIDTNINYKLNILISLYSVDNELNLNINENIKVKIIKEQNFIGEFILKHVKPKNKYKYVILLLDDIELNNSFNLENIINIYKNTKFPTQYNILSPTLTTDSLYSHKYMLNSSSNVDRIVKICEYFFYLMDTKSYEQYYKIFRDNPKYIKYMWGVDLILDKYKISAILLKSFSVKHYYKQTDGKLNNKCYRYMIKLIKNVNKYKKIDLNLFKFKSIKLI